MNTTRLLDGAVVKYLPRMFVHSFLERLRESTPWEQRTIKLYGREMPLPRLTAWYGDPGMSYTYSGIVNQPNPWNPLIAAIKKAVEDETGHRFNSALLNYYRNGSDSISWHADDEPELGKNPMIASVSIGAARTFLLRHNATKETHRFELENGSLLVMAGTCQAHYKHSLPRRASSGERINITFRNWLRR